MAPNTVFIPELRPFVDSDQKTTLNRAVNGLDEIAPALDGLSALLLVADAAPKLESLTSEDMTNIVSLVDLLADGVRNRTNELHEALSAIPGLRSA